MTATSADVAKVLPAILDNDPMWTQVHSGGHERYSDDDDRVCPECGDVWAFIWMDLWENVAQAQHAGIDSFCCSNGHRWQLVTGPPDVMRKAVTLV